MTRPLPRPALQSPPRSPRPPAEAPAEPAAPEPEPETPVEQALPPEPEAPTQPPPEEPVIQEPPPEPEPQAEPPPEEPMDLPEEPPEAPSEPAAPAFVMITAVALGGAAGSVTLTNFGGEPQNLEGWFLCQFPDYSPFPAVELGPGERIEISAASGADTAFRLFSNQAYGALDGGQGEVALYSDGQFADPGSIRSYVAWGGDSQRTQVARDAGIWGADNLTANAGDIIARTGGGIGADGYQVVGG